MTKTETSAQTGLSIGSVPILGSVVAMKSPYILSIVAVAAVLIPVLSLTPVTANAQATADATAKARGGPFPWQLTVYDRQGKIVRTLGEFANDNYPPAFSPDGTRLAVVQAIPGARGADIWVFDLSTGARTQVLSGPAPRAPVWSPDGSQIAYFSYRRDSGGGLYRKASNGTGSEELLYRFPAGVSDVHLTDWSPDGRFLTFDVSAVVWVLPLTGEGKAIELMREDFQVFGARFSHDSRFLAYSSDESGRNEIYVRAFDPSFGHFSTAGGKWQVSAQGGLGMGHWRGDDQELYYLAPDGGVMAVDVTTTPPFTAGPPRRLFRAPSSITLEGNPTHDDQYGRISRNGLRVAFQVRTPPDRKVITIASEVLAQYTGTYVSNRGSQVVVTLEGNQLMAETPGGRMCPSCGREKFPYFAESATRFFDRHPDSDADVEFVKDDKGVVTHFLAYQGGPGTRWTRTEANARAKGGPFPWQLTVHDRQGKVLRTVGEPTPCNPGCAPALSPDGTRLAVVGTIDPGTAADISVLDLSTGARTQVMPGPAWRARDELVMLGAFSPDGRQIAYFSYRHGYGGLYRRPSSGTGREQLLYRFPLGVNEVTLSNWSDGPFLVFQIGDGAGVLWVLPLTGERKAVELVREEFSATDAHLSPDSRFLAYGSDESGRSEVYVRAFDASSVRFSPAGGKWRVSEQGGIPLQWRQDGGELYYLAADGGVMGVEVTATPAFKAGPPKLLFRPPAGARAAFGSISRDGQRFAFRVPVPPERNVVTVAPEILAQYAGTYVNGNNSVVVSLESNQLMLEGPGGLRLPLFAESETDFFRRTRDSDSDFEFVHESGEVAHFIQYSGDAGTNWTRK